VPETKIKSRYLTAMPAGATGACHVQTKRVRLLNMDWNANILFDETDELDRAIETLSVSDVNQ
jgi:hypothetical protein